MEAREAALFGQAEGLRQATADDEKRRHAAGRDRRSHVTGMLSAAQPTSSGAASWSFVRLTTGRFAIKISS